MGVSRINDIVIFVWVWLWVDYVRVIKISRLIEVFLKKFVLLVRSDVELILRVIMNLILK